MSSGQDYSKEPVEKGGARFELHTLQSDTLKSYHLATQYVSEFTPRADVVIRTEDTYAQTPRTRADRPFQVDFIIKDLLEEGAEASKKVKVDTHVQSYGEGGDGTNLDRTQATLISTVYIESNGTHTVSYDRHMIPGADLSKVRGEMRFTVISLDEYQVVEPVLATGKIEIWPVADGTISGIVDGQVIGFTTPPITLTLNDPYPDSRIYAQVYPGEPVLGTQGTLVPGSAKIHKNDDALPPVKDWGSALNANGTWTVEFVISTPFGIDRLDKKTPVVDRTIKVKSSVTTID